MEDIQNLTQKETVNSEICKRCGGTCCKFCGCHFSPKDFGKVTFEYLKNEIEQKGYIAIDVVSGRILEDGGDVYILRARDAYTPVVDLGHRWKTPCMLLTENGCKLSYEDRPTGGKMLIPAERDLDGHRRCKQLYPIEECAKEWKTYQEVLIKLLEEFKEK